MTNTELLESFSSTLADILGADDLALAMETERRQVPGWDSFNYINFIVALEIQYDVKFRVSDVEAFKNVGDIVNELQSMLNDANT